VNDVRLIKIFDQQLDLYVMLLFLGLNPTTFQLFLSYPSTLFDPMVDKNSGNRELNLSSYPVLPLNFNLMADENSDNRDLISFYLSFLPLKSDPTTMKTLEEDQRSRMIAEP
jgi:hypothetical protein